MPSTHIRHPSRLVTALFALAALFSCAAVSLPARAAGPDAAATPISAIEVAGNLRIDTASIVAALTLKTGQPFDAAEADRSIKALFASGLYRDVSIRQDGERLVVTVDENPVIAAIKVDGASAITAKDLMAASPLRAGQPYTQARTHAEARRMEQLYRAQGRSGTSVEPVASPLPDGRVDLKFAVREGAVKRITRIVFTGNKQFDATRLKDIMASAESGWLDAVRSSSIADEARLAADQALILKAYRHEGFADAAVPLPRLIPDGEGYRLEIVIDEGERYVLAPARIDSAIGAFDTSPYQDLAGTSPGRTYDAEKLDKTLEAMAIRLAETGPDFAEVRLVLERDRAAHVITPIYRFEPGKRRLIERILLVGNQRTLERVIRREMSLTEGRPFSLALARRDKARLEKTGLFKSVDIEAVSVPEPGKVRVTVTVNEEDTRKLDYGIGYSFNDGVTGDVSLTENNLLGTGTRLKLSVLASEARWAASAGFTEPRFLDTPFSAGFDLLYQDADRTTQSSYQMRTYGGDIRTGVPLSDNLTFGLKYGLYTNEIYGVGAAASPAIRSAIPGFPDNTLASYLTSSIGTSLAWDDRDKKRMPSSGTYAVLTQDFAGLGGDVRYLRTTAEARAYIPLSKDITLGGRAVAGTIVGWGGDDVRLMDLFYKGGETVRGFATAGIGPRDVTSANQDALGGTTFMAATAETLFALPYVPESTGLKGEVFADAGSLWGTSKSAAAVASVSGTSPAPRVSVGAGVVWDSPLGAFRLDYAVPVVKQAFDKTQALSFGMVP